MLLSGMASLLRCLLSPFRKRGNERYTGYPALLNIETPVVDKVEEDLLPEPDSVVRAHLLLQLVGGENYGSITSSSCEMESELWSMLPEELLPTVLVMLPYISKLRFRAVCKEWRSLLSTPTPPPSTKLSNERDDVFPQQHPSRTTTPLICAYRFIHGNWLRDRGATGTDASASLHSCELRQKLKCRELNLVFPDILPTDSLGKGCKIEALVSAVDGVLSIEVWKERRLLHGKLRRHMGIPTVLEHFTYLLNPITDTVLSLPHMQTEGDHSLGRNLGLVSTKVEPNENPSSAARFDTSSFYWTSWWMDLGIGLRENTSWFTRVRHHPTEAGRYPESVNVRDRSGDRNLIGIGAAELMGGRFQAVISDGVVYGVHYPHDGSNRLFTRHLCSRRGQRQPLQPQQQQLMWSQWHDEASVPNVDDAVDSRFFLVEHRATRSVYYIGQACHRSGRLTNRICRLQSDCIPLWFWLPISVMPEPLMEEVMIRGGMLDGGQMPPLKRPLLDSAFVAGDFIILVLRNAGPPPEVCFVAFHICEETWISIFNNGKAEELAEFDGFFEVRSDLRFPRDIRGGMRL